uniref:Uncharacterized protein n=1 Tax=Amorphochlora amoebiformis TaxID=1561963 RepID=A0A6T6SWM4_9EUKA|mmetsp:Transcript_15994/g.25328  ORF Transcript_15994/g.25328 Transcript_15994/m.25328 type:complete len:187 (+) Transcript_15994:316-876(+)
MKTIDHNGWLHSGDLGFVDSEGYLKITGRIKELIITAGGENVAPVLIENQIKACIGIVSNAVVIGDNRKYLSCVLTLKCDMDEQGNPLDTLAPEALAFAKAQDSKATTVSEAMRCAKIRDAIQKGMHMVNLESTSRAQNIRKWIIVPKDFSLNGGELTPTMKLKRRVVNQKYAAEIETMYPVKSAL